MFLTSIIFVVKQGVTNHNYHNAWVHTRKCWEHIGSTHYLASRCIRRVDLLFRFIIFITTIVTEKYIMTILKRTYNPTLNDNISLTFYFADVKHFKAKSNGWCHNVKTDSMRETENYIDLQSKNLWYSSCTQIRDFETKTKQRQFQTF